MRPPVMPTVQDSPPTSADSIIEFTVGRRTWRVRQDFAWLIRESGVDWFALDLWTTAECVKHNTQRDVWRVSCGGSSYFAKVYHPAGLIARTKLLLRGPIASQEWRVGMYAATNGIATVRPVAMAWEHRRRTSGSSLLITEAVADAHPLQEYWRESRLDRVSAENLIDSLARLIARAHQGGFQHGDMHPGNILVRGRGGACELFFVDLHRVHTGRRVLPHHAIANLAQLNQWFRRNATRSQRLRFLASYIRYRDQFGQVSPLARNWPIDLRKLTLDLAIQADRHANRLWSKRDRRSMRSSRYYARVCPAPAWRGHALLQSKHPETGSGRTLTFTTRQWNEWLGDPLSWVDPARRTLLKDSHTATICKARLEGVESPIDVVVKRSLARNGWKTLAQMFGPSRNMRSWRMGHKLRNRDLPVATPLAVVERFALGLVRKDSIMMTEFVNDAVDLEAFLTRHIASLPVDRQRAVKDRLIEEVVRLLKAFHERGFVHRDMKAPNLMVRWEPPYDAPVSLTFIDMDGIFHRRRAAERQRIRAVSRLCASLIGSPGCTASDRLRFLKRYLTGPGRSPKDWKAVWRQIREEVCGKLQEKEVRRQWKLAYYGRE